MEMKEGSEEWDSRGRRINSRRAASRGMRGEGRARSPHRAQGHPRARLRHKGRTHHLARPHVARAGSARNSDTPWLEGNLKTWGDDG